MAAMYLVGVLLWLGCLALTFLSAQFVYELDAASTPILPFIGLMLGMTAIYLVAIRVAVRTSENHATWKTVIVFALAMRLMALFSSPIMELDYYRYLWDGETVLVGVSPYDYSPAQVLRASSDDSAVPEDLQRLVQIRDRNPQVATILSRIHYEELPSIYPPVSQAVFATAALTIPESASVETSIVVLKAWIVLFDMGVVLLILSLLKHLGLPIGWSVTYAWCPLVIKEFANSGHLDAIAVFFTVLAVWLLVTGLFPAHSWRQQKQWKQKKIRVVLGGIALGLSIGAKLYPVILAPIFLLTVLHKQGWRSATAFTIILTAITGITCWPQLGPSWDQKPIELTANNLHEENSIPFDPEMPPLPPMPGQETNRPSSTSQDDLTRQPEQKSLKVFLTQWKMNDFIFRILEANLTQDAPGQTAVWFAVVPNSVREKLSDAIGQRTQWNSEEVPFLITRLFLGVIFFLLALWWAWQGASQRNATDWLHFIFLTLAWFWVLSPTLNPWYWIWAMPFVVFSKRKTWFLLSGVVILYYTRFWFAYHWQGQAVFGTPYIGEEFFHSVLIWIEHLPWMLLLMGEMFFRKPFDLCNASQTQKS